MRKNGGHALLLEVLVALVVILAVVLMVASLFPTSYQATLQAARMTEAVNLARQVLERQKQLSPADAIGNQTVDAEFHIQGRPVICQFFYRVDADSAVNAQPRLWKVTVQWQHNGGVREVLLVGADPDPMRSCTRGFTLVETLVGLALFGLVSGVILAVFLMSHRYSRLYRQVSEAHRETVSCMQSISREVVRAHNQSVLTAVNSTWFLSSKPVETSVNQVEFDSVSGQLLWHKWIGIWCDGQGVVHVSEIPLSVGPQPFLSLDLATEPTSINAFTSLSRQRRLGASIVSLQFTKDAHLVHVDLTSETSTPGNPNTRYQLSSSFSTQ